MAVGIFLLFRQPIEKEKLIWKFLYACAEKKCSLCGKTNTKLLIVGLRQEEFAVYALTFPAPDACEHNLLTIHLTGHGVVFSRKEEKYAKLFLME